jgi:hypothetical protein
VEVLEVVRGPVTQAGVAPDGVVEALDPLEDRRGELHALYAGQAALEAVRRETSAEALDAAFERSLTANHADTRRGALQMDRAASVTKFGGSCRSE